MSRTHYITVTGMFIALGLLLPIAFHMIGGPALGRVFLPMHLPILLAGFLGGPLVGITAGIITPALSSLLTGMPPAPLPAIPMTIELAVYGLLAGILFRSLKQCIWVSLVGAMLGGRLIYGLIFAFVLPLFGWGGAPLAVWIAGTVIPSWPGIAIQVVAVPILVSIGKNFSFFQD